MNGDNPFELIVTISAEQWAEQQRRLSFLEAILSQVMRDNSQLREWFSARELASLGLNGLPPSPEGIARKAAHQGWRKRRGRVDGRQIYLYHYSSLPNAAFEAFIRRLIDMPDFEAFEIEEYNPPAPKAEPTPEWMLPLMRLIKDNRAKTWQEAYALLVAESHMDVNAQKIENAFNSINGI